MSESVIHDLDILRPKPEYVRLAEHDIDVSFIPSGVAMDIMAMQQKLIELVGTSDKAKKIEAGGDEARQTFEIAADLCASITESQFPEMNKEWLLRNTDVVQLKSLMDYVTQAVSRSLEGVEDTAAKKPGAVGASP